MFMLKKFCTLVCVFIFKTGVHGDESCFTPKNQTGSCINLRDCLELMKLIQKRPINSTVIDFLRESTCAFNGIHPKVCCPSYSNSSEIFSPESSNLTFVTTTESPETEFSTNLLPSTHTCGLQNEDRVLRGESSGLDQFPWLVLIEYLKPDGREFHCGGVLISKRYVLTAANCVKGKGLQETWTLASVRLGEYNTSSENDCETFDNVMDCAPPVENIPVEEQITHEQYDPNNISQYHDIALLRLARDVTFSDFIRPICLPVKSGLVTDHSYTVSGWGRSGTRNRSRVKLHIMGRPVNTSACNEIYSRIPVTLGSGQMCFSDRLSKSSCIVDNGGPLIAQVNYDRNYRWVAMGVFSFSPSICNLKGWPGVYTRVQDYLPWIIGKLRP